MTHCDDLRQEYEVTLLVPHAYRITAENDEDAKEQAAQRFAYAVKADAIGIPEGMRVKEMEKFNAS